MKKTKVINIFGGPGVGKSKVAHDLMSTMKENKYSVEYTGEFAKTLFWSERNNEIKNQFWVTANQYHLQYMLNGKVDWIISDSPLPLGLLYLDEVIPGFEDSIKHLFNKFENYNFYVEKTFATYENVGRWQTEKEAKEKNVMLKPILDRLGITYNTVTHYSCIDTIMATVKVNENKMEK